ncbi:unnamed protein product [Ambrosiozyma monospora]|uniref:Unnamed protein product n=1 Tax=Ambrosiozyma monospora TaxID=43982 RepID=A0ACB5U7C6_AMBMO|nr:unnamed protein product [Ambrosiozyma monospora]
MIGMLQRKSPTSIEPFKLLMSLFQLESVDRPVSKIEEVFMKMILIAAPENDRILEILSLLNSYSNIDPMGSKNCLLYVFNNKIDFKAVNPKAAEMCLTSLFWMNLVQIKDIDDTSKLENAKTLISLAERKFKQGDDKQCSSSIITLFWSMDLQKHFEWLLIFKQI